MKHKEVNPFYLSPEWKAVAAKRKEMDMHLCCDCVERFDAGGSGVCDADVVHHVIPLDQRPDLALDIDNLRSLCYACHNKKHPEKQQKAVNALLPAGRTAETLSRKGVNIVKI